MKRMTFAVLTLFLTSSAISGDIGEKVKNFALTDVQGNEHSLAMYGDADAIVIMFIATQCPVSNAYNERMVQLYKDYHDKNVVFLGINSNKQESVQEIQGHSEEHGFKFPVLKDVENLIADELKASVTPEIYVLNGERELLYQGRIDDSQRVSRIETQDLRTALDEVLMGKKVSNTKTKAFGCTIKRVG